MISKECNRTQRIADQVQRDLARIIQLNMHDPRIGLVTLNNVKISRDLKYADIYVTFMKLDDTDASRREALKVLNQASGYLRTRLGKALRLRCIPMLRFHYDATSDAGRRIDFLLNQIKTS